MTITVIGPITTPSRQKRAKLVLPQGVELHAHVFEKTAAEQFHCALYLVLCSLFARVPLDSNSTLQLANKAQSTKNQVPLLNAYRGHTKDHAEQRQKRAQL